MTEIQNHKRFDLEERTFNFAKRTRSFIKKLTRTITNIEDCAQLTRSTGSVGANYIEANEALSKKDFFLRIKICRKEAKESKYWFGLIDIGNNQSLDQEKKELIQESLELMKIFGSILEKNVTKEF